MLAVIVVVAGAAWLVKHNREARWAREVALPEITRLSDQGKPGVAYALALSKPKNQSPAIAALTKLWPRNFVSHVAGDNSIRRGCLSS